MPIFEYSCDACGHLFEKIILSPNAPDVLSVACPGCGSAGVTRRLSTFAAHSGGTGPGKGSGGGGESGPSGGGCGRPGGCGCA
jgi:putative FmdB family regulatory protein